MLLGGALLLGRSKVLSQKATADIYISASCPFWPSVPKVIPVRPSGPKGGIPGIQASKALMGTTRSPGVSGRPLIGKPGIEGETGYQSH